MGWPKGATPTPTGDLPVNAFAQGLDHPRWIYALPNGDVLVAETNAPPRSDDGKGIKGWVADKIMKRAGANIPSANRITLLRDSNGDGVADTRSVLLSHLNSTFGMALVGDWLYVADTDALLRFPYRAGEIMIKAPGQKVIDLPAGPIDQHWTKNIIASPDGPKLYITVGSNSNVGEDGLEAEQRSARILQLDLASAKQRPYATGLRNPNGMASQPQSGALWVAVNERDELGSDPVPDYMTAVKDGGFYGWPWSYYGQHVDARVRPPNPAKVAQAIAPDYALATHGIAGSHVLQRPPASGRARQRCVHRSARLMEPPPAQRLQSHLRAVCGGQAQRLAAGRTHRVSGRKRPRARATRRRGHRQCRSAAGGRRCG